MTTLLDKSTNNDDHEQEKTECCINVQSLYNKIESIKSTVSMVNAERPELWIQRQNLQDLFHQIILNDIEFTIDKKLEQELWNFVFKNQISYFQSQIKENSSSSLPPSAVTSSQPVTSKNKNLMAQKKLEAQANLSFFLEAARGFYTKLLDDLVKKYNLNEIKKDNSGINVSFYQHFPSLFDQINFESNQIEATKEKQILYICQHTLTHLGDIARYANQFEEAKNYYLHAIKLVPYLGHPYNQLGILFETSRTNQLSTVFYYIRSIATRYTFPLASTNLENFFHKLIDAQISRYNPAQLSQKDLLTLFLQINAILHSLQTGKNAKSLNSNCAKLKNFYDLFNSSFQNFINSSISIDKLDSSQFCQIVSIVIFQLSQTPGSLVQADSKTKENFDSANKTALDLFIFFVQQFINFYNKSIKSSTSQHHTNLVLPSLYLSFSFMETYKSGDLIKKNGLFTQNDETTKIFDALIFFLNSLNTDLKSNSQETVFSDYPLLEDRMLDGFLPFKDVHKNFSFKKYMSNNQLLEESEEKLLRKKRIVSIFEKLATDCPECYLRVEEGEVKFAPSKNYPFKTEELKPEIKVEPPKRRRQNIALSSITSEMDKNPHAKDNLLLIRPSPSPQPPRFPSFSSASMTAIPQNQRLIPNQQWQATPNASNFQTDNFFPSASSRQFAMQNMPQTRLPHSASLNNGFPSFLPNEKSSNTLINRNNQQIAPPGFQNEMDRNNTNNDAYLSNLLIQQLMTNTRSEANKSNPLEYNLNMINYMQMQNTNNQEIGMNPMNMNSSIWSYSKVYEMHQAVASSTQISLTPSTSIVISFFNRNIIRQKLSNFLQTLNQYIQEINILDTKNEKSKLESYKLQINKQLQDLENEAKLSQDTNVQNMLNGLINQVKNFDPKSNNQLIIIDPVLRPLIEKSEPTFFENRYGFKHNDLFSGEFRDSKGKLFRSKQNILYNQTRGFKTKRKTSVEEDEGLFNWRSLGLNKSNEDPFKSLSNLISQKSESKPAQKGAKLGSIFGDTKKPDNELNNLKLGNSSDVDTKIKTAFIEGFLYKQAKDEKNSRRQSNILSLIRFIAFMVIIYIIFNSISISTISSGNTRNGNGNGINIRALTGNVNFEVNPENVSVRFDDVKGLPEAKKELTDIVDFLKDPEKYTRLGARLPKGVLLVGPPGCGKTLLAKSVAGEAGVPFFQASGSDFDEMFVGTGSKRVRQLFAAARAKAPCVIFIDEIDSVGSTRTNSMIHPHANQTINQLLAEMDGFQKNEGVIVLGATNRRDTLDTALLRPGRFDVEVRIDKPDLNARIEILEFYLDKVAKDKNVDVNFLAKQLSGFGGSSIENIVNQAALRAAVASSNTVKMEHLEWALDRTLLGYGKSRLADEECNKNTAYHEAGHVLVAYYTKDSDPLHKVTILPRSQSLGHTAFVPDNDGYSMTRSQLLAKMDVSMGGRVAEEIIFGQDKVTTGALSDFKSATNIATQMVKSLGMSEKVGVRVFDEEKSPGVSSSTQEMLDQEIKKMLQESYDRAKSILKTHSVELKLIAEALLTHETLDVDQIKSLIENHKL